MIRRQTVTVRLAEFGAADAFGNPVLTWRDPVEVDGVVVAPVSTADDTASSREGVVRRARFFFPDRVDADLRDAVISWRGASYRVAGQPERYPDGSTRNGLNLWCEAVARHG